MQLSVALLRTRQLVAGLLVLAATLLLATSPVRAQAYPDHPIRMVVPYSAGGVTDITARLVVPFIAQELGGTVFIDNRPGGASMIGTEIAAKAKPDGYTLLLNSGGALSANPSLFRSMPYDTAKDILPVAMIATVPYVLAVSKRTVAETPQQFIALAKAKPGSLNYSSAGNGSGNHLTAELFMNAAGITAQHIPYKGGGEMVTALVADQVTFTLAALPSALSFIQGGTIKALAVTSLKPSALLPNVPTLASTAMPGFDVTEWLGIFAPAGTPSELVAKINAATNRALAKPELIEKLRLAGAEANPGPTELLDKTFRGDMARWAKVAKQINFELQ